MAFKLDRNSAIAVYMKDTGSEAVTIALENLKKDLKATLDITVDPKAEVKIIIETRGTSGENFSLRVCGGKLQIVGGGRRGTVYGIYTLSEMLGVSPWYFWADVPIRKLSGFSLDEGYELYDAPTIPYRGIFINDEEELDKWARLHMDEPTIGVNTYEKIFELILRLKGNYIWPAMHVNSFNQHKENGALANRMGIVVGTSHCDMLMRSNYREWEPWLREKGYEGAVYDYSFEGRNREILREYWRESAEQNRDFEVSYTLGMRGIHDSGFVTGALKADTEEELKERKVELLEQVIKDQKQILKDVVGPDTLTTFVPYKEVMDLYDRGLKVPEDVTLIWTNDNYGYVRRYPSQAEQNRAGGNGIYYHNSYWAPTLRHYLFVSSIPVARTKYEMDKAYENGIRKLWVCNMGALKPLEQEMEYFLRLAWDYGKKNAKVNDPEEYLADWIDRNFTRKIGRRTAKLLNRYARVSDTRKVEMMEEDVFGQDGVNEAAVRLNTLKEIFEEGNDIYEYLPENEKAMFFELVLMKLHAAYYTAAMYYFADRSRKCFAEGRHGASRTYTKCSKAFEDLRRALIHYYNKELMGGKWDGILTPEDFPPPRTAMHPASVPSVVREEGTDDSPSSGPFMLGIDGTGGSLKGARIIKGLGRGTQDLVELGDSGRADYRFEVPDKGEYALTVFRYPSLDSVGRIAFSVRVDGGRAVECEACSNDEWRGTWEQNVMDNVDRIRIDIGTLKRGHHKVRIEGGSRYFSFYRIVICKADTETDNLGGILPGTGDFAGNSMPGVQYVIDARKIFYGSEATEYTIPVGSFVNGRNVSDSTDSTDYLTDPLKKKLFMPDRVLLPGELREMGKSPYAENGGNIVIEAFGAYNRTEYANLNGPWEYCSGVTYGRDNLALWIRARGQRFAESEAPALDYVIEAEGGEYTVYALIKFNERPASRIRIELDGEPLESAWKGESPWRYEGEQPFRYVPLMNTKICKGRHRLTVKIYSSGLRIERILLTGTGNGDL